jgi:hypothetical protein
MWRSFFLAIGISLCILGGECLVIEKAVLAAPKTSSGPVAGEKGGILNGGRREYKPPDWMPWSLLSIGSVVILYSFTIPRRVAGG